MNAVRLFFDKLGLDIVQRTYEHVYLTVIALAIAVAISVPAGVLLAHSRRGRLVAAVMGAVAVIQTVPSLALVGSYDGFNNDLDGGLDTEVNQRSWTIGIGLQMNLFEGGRTKYKVSAAKTEHAKMEQQRLLVTDAVATQVKNLFLQTQAAREQVAITEQALATSKENRSLTSRAYQTGAVETQKVIEADLFDAMIRANHYRAQHDQALHLAEISYLLGKEAMN